MTAKYKFIVFSNLNTVAFSALKFLIKFWPTSLTLQNEVGLRAGSQICDSLLVLLHHQFWPKPYESLGRLENLYV